MKLKNAGFESELDMMTALVGGETVYFSVDICTVGLKFVDGRLTRKFIHGLGSTEVSKFDLISMYQLAKVECKWYENITKPVPCWVKNNGDDEMDIALIDDYDADFEVKYSDINDRGWRCAIPMEACDLLGGDDSHDEEDERAHGQMNCEHCGGPGANESAITSVLDDDDRVVSKHLCGKCSSVLSVVNIW